MTMWLNRWAKGCKFAALLNTSQSNTALGFSFPFFLYCSAPSQNPNLKSLRHSFLVWIALLLPLRWAAEETSIIFTTLGRAFSAFDIYSLPIHHHQPPTPHQELPITDDHSFNFNGHFLSNHTAIQLPNGPPEALLQLVYITERNGFPSISYDAVYTTTTTTGSRRRSALESVITDRIQVPLLPNNLRDTGHSSFDQRQAQCEFGVVLPKYKNIWMMTSIKKNLENWILKGLEDIHPLDNYLVQIIKDKPMSVSRFLFSNGILSHTLDAPSVKVFLEAHPGAYTTSRTHNNASCLLFWERHMKRLSESIQILSNLAPQLLFKSNNSAISLPSSPSLPVWNPAVQMLVNDSVGKVLPIALKERIDCEELAITTLVSGNLEDLNACETMSEEKVSKIFDVHVHVETYVPPEFGIRGNGARLAVGGYGRHVAAAKYSDWVRIRKTMEKLRPPSVTELLLSNNGDQILEGCVTNFFVVCRKDWDSDDGRALCGYGNKYSFEVQTAPISDGVLPGTIRQLVLEVCRSEGIPFQEVAPSWSEHEIWEEAFITNSLRLLQHVDNIQVPTEWQSAHSKTWKDISWTKQQFQGGPGVITTLIQEKVMEKAILEGYPINNICTR